MNRKMMSYKPPPPPRNASRQQPSSKPPKPKPEWNMDFGDTDKYKLTQTEMIQKKAALQSANMQQAKEQLAERRRKLEDGVIDEETRKIYETALTSKRIDPNPSIRRNLSQMINYQRDILSQSQRSMSKRKSEQQICVEEELKNTKEFIRKMERASKAKDVVRAVQILQQKPKLIYSSQVIKSQVDMSSMKKLTPLQNIEQTIKFMEERLFKTKQPTVRQVLPSISIQQPSESVQPSLPSGRTSKTQNINENHSLEISRIPKQDYRQNYVQSPIKDKDDQDDWLNTIRRMNHLIENQERKFEPENSRQYEYTVVEPSKSRAQHQDLGYVRQQLNYEASPIAQDENKNTMNIPTDRRVEEQVDFSLTIYNENSLRIDTDQFFDAAPMKTYQKQIEKSKSPAIIKSTSRGTLEISRLTTFSKPLVQEIEPNEDDEPRQSYYEEPSLSFQQIRFTNQMIKTVNSKRASNPSSNSKPNPEAQRIKRLLDDTKRNLDSVVLTKLQVPTFVVPQSSGISLKRLAR